MQLWGRASHAAGRRGVVAGSPLRNWHVNWHARFWAAHTQSLMTPPGQLVMCSFCDSCCGVRTHASCCMPPPALWSPRRSYLLPGCLECSRGGWVCLQGWSFYAGAQHVRVCRVCAYVAAVAAWRQLCCGPAQTVDVRIGGLSCNGWLSLNAWVSTSRHSGYNLGLP